MNHQTDHQEQGEGGSALDSLVLILDREIAALRLLHYRMSVLRLMLLDGNTSFVQRAADETEAATAAVVEFDVPREQARSGSAKALGLSPSAELLDIVDAAPDSHEAVLRRLATDLAHLSRGIAVLRDAIRSLAEEGRRGVLSLLDLTDPAPSSSPFATPADESAPRIFVGEF